MFDTLATYSQMGEDRIVYFFFRYMLEREHVSYIDIGANDPVRLNNTYLLYREFSNKHGVLVDANPACVKKLKRKRKKDLVVNYGLSADGKGSLGLYRFKSDTLNTFSEEDALAYEAKGNKLLDKIDVPMISINELHDQFFDSSEDVDFLSIDIEGMDFDVLKSIQFDRWKPLTVCVESSEYYGDKRADFDEIVCFFKSKGYVILGDTWINTLFVRKELIEEYIELGKTSGRKRSSRIRKIKNKINYILKRRIVFV